MDPVKVNFPVHVHLVTGSVRHLCEKILRMTVGWAIIGLMPSSMLHGPPIVLLPSVALPGTGHPADSMRRAPMVVANARITLVVTVRISCYHLLTANVTLT